MTNQIPSWARVGAKVVCVGDQWKIHEGLNCPKKAVVYTIRKIIYQPWTVGLRLVEIVNEPKYYLDGFVEAAFGIGYFRPIQTKNNRTRCSNLCAVARD